MAEPRVRLQFARFLIWIGVILLGLGCSQMTFKAGNPWQPGEARFFDDGVDMIRDTSTLSGRWAYEQEDLLRGRVQLSDLIARVEIRAIQTNFEIGLDPTRRIQVAVVEPFYGKSPSPEISLASSPDSPGFGLLERHEKRLEGEFILFIRWFSDPDDTQLKHHFHLSPASQEMVSLVKRRIHERSSEEHRATLSK